MDIKYTQRIADVLQNAVSLAHKLHNEFITPEHVLLELVVIDEFRQVVDQLGGSSEYLVTSLENYVTNLEKLPSANATPDLSMQFQELMAKSAMSVTKRNSEAIAVSHIVDAIFSLKDSWANTLLNRSINDRKRDFLEALDMEFRDDKLADASSGLCIKVVGNREEPGSSTHANNERTETKTIEFVKCFADLYKKHTPVIGRENELSMIVEALCRCENKNVLLVGEHGVGKRAMMYKLSQMIDENNVPSRLAECTVFDVDLSSLSAGIQFKGELEGRIRFIFDDLMKRYGKNKVIIYLDGIHTLMSNSVNNDGGFDIVGLFNSYIEEGALSFIAATSFEDISKHTQRYKRFLRRFQRIEVKEPSLENSIEILNVLKNKYEKFHHVKYTDEAIRSAVTLSSIHIKDRFLPEKAVDLIDQAGAHSEASMAKRKKRTLGKNEIVDTLAVRYGIKTSNIAAENMLADLSSNMLSKIYGQDKAIEQVVNAVHMWKAGLVDSEKPIANLLFVGPTGVGKTEVARTLAKEMGVELQRFDMSEYAEKHTVAKLIGSPAGYIGYDDGGLLTEAIRKTPNCVLLFDEIEKAHPDIFNILLQVMDYGSLTDNKGQKAIFNNVLIILTSNAGAQHAHTASLGFASKETSGSFMLNEVKKIFKPEFLNRLTGTVVFNDMDMHMAELILDKKMGEFNSMLVEKSIEMIVSDEARKWLLNKGFTKEYGAREIDRVVANDIKPLFVKEILFGGLKNGGKALVDIENGELTLKVEKK